MNAGDDIRLRIGDHTVAHYVVRPPVDSTAAARPYLHPVRTFDGVVVTDAAPTDHRWHLGASLAVPDVSGTNLWGGRTYVRDLGYTWRDDHGRIVHVDFVAHADDRLAERLRWCDPTGDTLLHEQRWIGVRPLPDRSDAWVLDLAYTLTAPPDRDVRLASPATHGRPGGEGYGGFFWRAAPAPSPPRVFTASANGEMAVNGSTAPWVALSSLPPVPYTLVFTGLGDGDHWFVRTRAYPGVCAALAYDRPRLVAAGSSLTGRHAVVVADAVFSRRTAGRAAAAAAVTADDLADR